jgi:hypothetical protein
VTSDARDTEHSIRQSSRSAGDDEAAVTDALDSESVIPDLMDPGVTRGAVSAAVASRTRGRRTRETLTANDGQLRIHAAPVPDTFSAVTEVERFAVDAERRTIFFVRSESAELLRVAY